MQYRATFLLMMSTMLAACKESAAPAKPSPTVASPILAAEPAFPDLLRWDPAGKAKAWVGSWVVQVRGAFQAWTIGEDGLVQVYESGGESRFTLDAAIPCYAYFTTEAKIKFPYPFTVTSDGKLRVNVAGGGYKKGSEALFCDRSGTIYTLAANGKCQAWELNPEWTRVDGECSLGKDAQGKDVFKHGNPNAGEFAIEGDTILGGRSPTLKAENHEAAKQMAKEKNAALSR